MRPHAATTLAPTRAPDEHLVQRARAGDEHALDELLRRYRPYVRARARAYFLVGGDLEDLTQEGMIGLYKAVLDFDAGRRSSFRGFAALCVTRQIISAIKAATRHKHGPLNTYISLHAPSRDDGNEPAPLLEVLPAAGADPAERVVSIDDAELLRRTLADRLSDLEAEVLRRYVEGQSYEQMADGLHRHTKAIDNALQRVKRKVGGYLAERWLEESA